MRSDISELNTVVINAGGEIITIEVDIAHVEQIEAVRDMIAPMAAQIAAGIAPVRLAGGFTQRRTEEDIAAESLRIAAAIIRGVYS